MDDGVEILIVFDLLRFVLLISRGSSSSSGGSTATERFILLYSVEICSWLVSVPSPGKLMSPIAEIGRTLCVSF